MYAIDRARLPWRHWLRGLIILATALASSLAPACAEESQTLRLAAGRSSVISLKDNPSAGYGWQLNNAASRNLALVGIADAGFVRDSKLVGAPGQRRFGITARQPGTAVAVFDYARPWERVAPARRHTVTIRIGR
jgi:predicted secreted protein